MLQFMTSTRFQQERFCDLLYFTVLLIIILFQKYALV